MKLGVKQDGNGPVAWFLAESEVGLLSWTQMPASLARFCPSTKRWLDVREGLPDLVPVSDLSDSWCLPAEAGARRTGTCKGSSSKGCVPEFHAAGEVFWGGLRLGMVREQRSEEAVCRSFGFT